MRHIDKGSEPAALRRYREKRDDPNRDSYDAFPHKDELRAALLRDQGHLCCYCMVRVDAASMKIEHLHSRSTHPSAALDWPNLLACCRGGEGGPPSDHHCDTRKGDRELSLHPSSERVRHLRYAASGRIDADEVPGAPQNDIDEILNLNHPMLVRNRRAALDALVRSLRRELGSGRWTADTLVRKLSTLRSEPRLISYFGVVEYFVEREIRRRR